MINRQTKKEILEFIEQYNFATLVSQVKELPFATHLPLTTEWRNEQLVLLGHMAKANPQWKNFEAQKILAIFQGPHAYISPGLYNKKRNVPTWDYIAVHIYGQVNVLTGSAATFELLEKQISVFEKSYLHQWADLSEEYKNGLRNGMVAFEISVDEIQARYKLSQNKTRDEQERIAKHLQASEDIHVSFLGKKIGEQLDKKNLHPRIVGSSLRKSRDTPDNKINIRSC